MRTSLAFALRLGLALVAAVSTMVPACSNDSTGLRRDGASSTPDTFVSATGGSGGAFDARGNTADSSVASTGGLGPQGGSTGAQGGSGGGRLDGASNVDSSLGGTGGTVRIDATVSGGSGGSASLDGAVSVDTAADTPTTDVRRTDTAVDTRPPRADGPVGRDTRSERPAIDTTFPCGDLGMACCAHRTCNTESLACINAEIGAEATCVTCGGADQPCCEDDVCTAPGTTCTGGGRSGGTCR